MKTVEYLDALQKSLNLPSDYAVAKALKISKQAMSGYRTGRSQFDDEVATKVANALGIHPGIVMLDMHAERTKNEETRSIWREISAGFPALSLQANSARGMLPCW